jgi:ABC-type multidrug transport system fused ATPase/permease subunit
MKFAKPEASDTEIEKALKDANAWDFIQKRMD